MLHSNVSIQYLQGVRPRVLFVKASTDGTFGHFCSIFIEGALSRLAHEGVH
jgi:hypothetical protein